MKRKTFLWQVLFSLVFLGLIIKALFNTPLFFEISLLAVFSLGVLAFSKQRDNLILIHNALNLLLITIVFLTGIRGVDTTLAFLVSVVGLIFTSISLELEEREKRLGKLGSRYIENLQKKEINDKKSEQVKKNEFKSSKKKQKTKKNIEKKSEHKPVRYVAGKFSNQYHVESCPVAKRLIKKRYYESKDRAEFAGLKPHNCVK